MAQTLDIPADPSQETIVRAEDLTDLMVHMLKKKGMYEAEARVARAADRGRFAWHPFARQPFASTLPGRNGQGEHRPADGGHYAP